jgi:hypothetical protein
MATMAAKKMAMLGRRLACSGAALALASFLAGLEVSTTTAAPSVTQGIATVNRTLKCDRLPRTAPNTRNDFRTERIEPNCDAVRPLTRNFGASCPANVDDVH